MKACPGCYRESTKDMLCEKIGKNTIKGNKPSAKVKII